MNWNWGWDLLNGWQWAALFAVPPLIVLLYFLKLKREPMEVPSTYLWTRTVEDLHVNSIWQRLRRNLLLFLQLLLLLLAILSLLNLSWRGNKLEDDRVIFLVDNSASMSATDVSPSRLEEAKRQVSALIDEMKSTDIGMIIAFSDEDGARTIQSYTNNRRLLKRKLEGIKPTHRKTDLKKALRFAAGLANPGRTAYEADDAAAADAMPATLFIFSDGRVSGSPEFFCAAPLTGSELTRYFGTDKPTRQHVERSNNFWEDIDRGHCRYVVLYEGETPKHLYFAGYSFD